MIMIRRRIIILISFFLFFIFAKGEDRMTVNGVQYSTTSKSTVTAYMTVKAIGEIEIKESIVIKGKEYITTEIGKAYFNKNEYLQAVVIPNSVKKIKKGAFAGCTNLANVHIPKEGCLAEDEAFKGCTSITFISTDDSQLYPVDYILASMPKVIPYYKIKDKVASPWKSGGTTPTLDDVEWDVDNDIPVTKKQNLNTFAFIIGNEDYSLGGSANVDFATNDAFVFKQYCHKTLGIPEENIKCYTNQTLGLMRRTIRLLKQTANINYKKDCRIIFYYSGHGIPNEATKDAYLVPVDADGRYTEDCYSLNELYKELGTLPVKKVYVFLDACFSGAQRGDGMLMAARGMALVPKKENPQGSNMVIFSATTGDETAYPYKDKRHGMFTYYLLNMLYRTKGACNIGELGAYVEKRVKEKSIAINSKQQTPTVSSSMQGEWKNLTLK
ncbi:MAG: hypothetical protein E7103_05820 [Prevotella sp.]|nr:hypothetical protein [Prevotella sp.]